MADDRDALKKARKRAAREAKKRKRDPAWVYLAVGILCIGTTVLFSLYGNHFSRPTVSPRGLPGVKTPFEIYVFTILTGAVFIIIGMRKLLRATDSPEQE